MTESMVPGRLYVCKKEVRLKGHLSDGREAFSLVAEGTPVIPVLGHQCEAILIDGAVVPFSWSSQIWKYLFDEATDG